MKTAAQEAIDSQISRRTPRVRGRRVQGRELHRRRPATPPGWRVRRNVVLAPAERIRGSGRRPEGDSSPPATLSSTSLLDLDERQRSRSVYDRPGAADAVASSAERPGGRSRRVQGGLRRALRRRLAVSAGVSARIRSTFDVLHAARARAQPEAEAATCSSAARATLGARGRGPRRFGPLSSTTSNSSNDAGRRPEDFAEDRIARSLRSGRPASPSTTHGGLGDGSSVRSRRASSTASRSAGDVRGHRHRGGRDADRRDRRQRSERAAPSSGQVGGSDARLLGGRGFRLRSGCAFERRPMRPSACRRGGKLG